MAHVSPILIDHVRNPRNRGRIAHPETAALVRNPVCGDEVYLTASIDGDANTVSAVAFEALGCSAALAVASLLTTILGGATLSQITELDRDTIIGMCGGLPPEHRHSADLGVDAAHRLVENFRNGSSDAQL
jgi:nitrogen fixation NifU-like protein